MPEEQAQPVRTDYNTQPAQPYSQPQQETAPQAPAYPEPEASYGQEERNDSAAYVQQPYEGAAAEEEAVNEEEYPEEEVSQEEEERREDERLEQEIRSMSREEKQLFASFVPTKGAMKRLVPCAGQAEPCRIYGKPDYYRGPGLRHDEPDEEYCQGLPGKGS